MRLTIVLLVTLFIGSGNAIKCYVCEGDGDLCSSESDTGVLKDCKATEKSCSFSTLTSENKDGDITISYFRSCAISLSPVRGCLNTEANNYDDDICMCGKDECNKEMCDKRFCDCPFADPFNCYERPETPGIHCMQCKGIGGLCEKDEIGESVQCPFGEKTCMYVAYEFDKNGEKDTFEIKTCYKNPGGEFGLVGCTRSKGDKYDGDFCYCKGDDCNKELCDTRFCDCAFADPDNCYPRPDKPGISCLQCSGPDGLCENGDEGTPTQCPFGEKTCQMSVLNLNDTHGDSQDKTTIRKCFGEPGSDYGLTGCMRVKDGMFDGDFCYCNSNDCNKQMCDHNKCSCPFSDPEDCVSDDNNNNDDDDNGDSGSSRISPLTFCSLLLSIALLKSIMS